jgi:hypothetical protein
MIEELKRFYRSVFAWTYFVVVLTIAAFLLALPIILLAGTLAYLLFPPDARVAGFFILFWLGTLVMFLLDNPRR